MKGGYNLHGVGEGATSGFARLNYQSGFIGPVGVLLRVNTGG